MYSVTVTTYFWASHQITLPDGTLEPVHSHNWSACAEIACENLDDAGMVVDFILMKERLDSIVANLSGDNMVKNSSLLRNNTTAESVAKYIYEGLEKEIPAGRRLVSVAVTESPGCAAKFSSK